MSLKTFKLMKISTIVITRSIVFPGILIVPLNPENEILPTIKNRYHEHVLISLQRSMKNFKDLSKSSPTEPIGSYREKYSICVMKKNQSTSICSIHTCKNPCFNRRIVWMQRPLPHETYLVTK